ncbi:nucleotide exchange factor GrpE [Meridianimarinicoccus aquatilis]|uniref:Protein GrpE n=1 Tax=Meridianimarinicoccus aquatilis TaxID=2552766 RepID=A0A4R6AYH9_9RHOB|nr:nucleotide exchange factor GrpE [Fluviibacterium aquatile]QIE41018.1 nucleotide exchange factor GrpE [Rhodobacteraceae bacterium SC52]TDL89320.1 nucleotide exchange factor GrpE [Fluviibacterium aquatile]
MADANKKDITDLEDILSAAGDEPPVDIDALAEGADEFDAARDSDLHAELEAVRAERDDMRDRFMRALADAENARKRSDKDRREAENYGGSKLARDLLPVYDNLSRALAAASTQPSDEDKAVLEGVELTLRELTNIFNKHGIVQIDPQKGDKFDPQQHQAMFEAPVPGTKSGEIIEVMALGFMLHDRLLRPAQVGVSSNPG